MSRRHGDVWEEGGVWWVQSGKRRCRVKGERTCDDDRACPRCCTWRDAPMFAPRRGKKPCLTCTICRDDRKTRGPTKGHLACKAVHDAWKARQAACGLCGGAFDDDDDTETDHIDETKKECRAAMFSAYDWYAAHGGAERLARDLMNGQLLHTKCHRQKSRAAQKRKRDPDVIATFTAGAARRTCTRCKREQRADRFVSHSTRHPTWTKSCQTCRDYVIKSMNNPSTVPGSIRKRYRDEKARLDEDGVCACGCGASLRNRAFDTSSAHWMRGNVSARCAGPSSTRATKTSLTSTRGRVRTHNKPISSIFFNC
jgi:hypothetical protein